MLGYRPHAEKTDRALTALSHVCRRRLLFELYEEVNSGKRTSINYTDITPPELESEQEHVRLYHTHLPKLEASEYITWDKAEKTIRKGPRWEEVEPFVDLISAHLDELPSFPNGTASEVTGTKR